MAKEYLDKTGLNALWSLIKTAINQLVEIAASKVSKSGDTMSGDLDMCKNNLLGVQNIVNDVNDPKTPISCKSFLQIVGFWDSNANVGGDKDLVQGDGKFRSISSSIDSTQNIPTCAAVNSGLAGKANAGHTHSSIKSSTNYSEVLTDSSNVKIMDNTGEVVFKTLNGDAGKCGAQIFNGSDNTVAEFSTDKTIIYSPDRNNYIGVKEDAIRLKFQANQGFFQEMLMNSTEVKIKQTGEDSAALQITTDETALKYKSQSGVRCKSGSTECKFGGKGLTLTGTESKLTATTAVRILAPDVYIGAEDDQAKLHLNGTELGSTIQYLDYNVDHLLVQTCVELMCLAKGLYIICDKGYIKSTDGVTLFRYVRSNNRYSTFDNATGIRETTGRRRTIGWKEPKVKKSGTSQLLVPLQLHQETAFTTLAAQKDVWQVCRIAGSTVTPIIDVFETYNTNNMRLFNKKCGVRLQRDGEWITGYLPFMARKTYDVPQGVYIYGIGRWSR